MSTIPPARCCYRAVGEAVQALLYASARPFPRQSDRPGRLGGSCECGFDSRRQPVKACQRFCCANTEARCSLLRAVCATKQLSFGSGGWRVRAPRTPLLCRKRHTRAPPRTMAAASLTLRPAGARCVRHAAAAPRRVVASQSQPAPRAPAPARVALPGAFHATRRGSAAATRALRSRRCAAERTTAALLSFFLFLAPRRLRQRFAARRGLRSTAPLRSARVAPRALRLLRPHDRAGRVPWPRRAPRRRGAARLQARLRAHGGRADRRRPQLRHRAPAAAALGRRAAPAKPCFATLTRRVAFGAPPQVVGRFNDIVTRPLLEGALATIERHGTRPAVAPNEAR